MLRAGLAILALVVGGGCFPVAEEVPDAPAHDSGDDTGAPTVDTGPPCEPTLAVTWDNFGHSFVLTHCQGCHASAATDRFGAPESVSFDDEAETLAQAQAIWDAVLTRGSMPPAGGLTDDERTLVEQWLLCEVEGR